MSEPRTVKVGCDVPNGVMIQLWKPGFDDGTGDGERPMVRDGRGVRLNGPPALHTGAGNTAGAGLEPGITEVDAGWFAKWLEQRELDPLVVGGHVFEVKDEDGNPTRP